MEWMDQQFKLISLDTRMATEDDQHLTVYDHTKLSAINTCPTYGILRYTKHKKMPGTKRSMALEAGSAAHECFAAIRLYQFHRTVIDKTGAAIEDKHGIRLFGEHRYEQMRNKLSAGSTDRTNCINFALEALYSSGFYDDIEDNRRTVSNISESIILHINDYNFERFPLWIRDPNDRDTDIGIEIPFDVVVDVTYADGLMENSKKFRFYGKLDCLHYFETSKDLLVIEEKTGARLDNSWLSQWILSHQITGYCIASSTFTGIPCLRALVSGLRIPVGKIPHESIRKEMVPRTEILFEKWANWFITTVETNERWGGRVLDAPMYTHSCNRYFSTCEFLPFCAAETREEKQQIMREMEHDEWNPLQE